MLTHPLRRDRIQELTALELWISLIPAPIGIVFPLKVRIRLNLIAALFASSEIGWIWRSPLDGARHVVEKILWAQYPIKPPAIVEDQLAPRDEEDDQTLAKRACEILLRIAQLAWEWRVSGDGRRVIIVSHLRFIRLAIAVLQAQPDAPPSIVVETGSVVSLVYYPKEGYLRLAGSYLPIMA